MKTIISASRRTDIPAFYYEWLQECLKNRSVTLANPLYPEKKYTVDLSPDNVHSIVLWSKNFINVLKDPKLLKDYNLYFQYTITGYSRVLEPNVPPYEKSIEILKGLLDKGYKPEQFNIRFDPILLSTKGEVKPNYEKPGLARLEMFERLCSDLKSLGMDNCRLTTSYISMYGHTEKNLNKAGIDYISLSEDAQIKFMKKMSEIAQKYNRDIYTCANDRFVKAGIPNIKKGHCIDGDVLEGLFGKCTKSKDPAQRAECGCIKSRDIGQYTQPCKHACRYCYANPAKI